MDIVSRFARSPLALALALALVAPVVVAQEKTLSERLVEGLDGVSGGAHPGYRANHAKGFVVTGSFTPAPGATSLSKAPHLAKTVPVVVRFSDPTGIPNIPDASPDATPHGMAIRFMLPGGLSTDIVSISVNSFPVATPEDFASLLEAAAKSGPNAPKPTPIEQFLGSHPAALKFVTTPHPAPESFATLAYFGVNAFKFTNAKGETKFARYQILPLAGEHGLDEAQAKAAAPNYLFDELPARLAKGPIKFKLVAQVADASDKVDDATVTWPAERKVVTLGTITLTKPAADQAIQKTIVFNPVSLPDGIAPSADPILNARFPAYVVSYRRRLTSQ